MNYLPYIDTSSDQNDGMNRTQDITVIILAYISIFLYLCMFSLELYNVYKFLYKQGKYKVYPVSLFYALAIPITILRIISNLWIVP